MHEERIGKVEICRGVRGPIEERRNLLAAILFVCLVGFLTFSPARRAFLVRGTTKMTQSTTSEIVT
jgi:hypothetical protein